MHKVIGKKTKQTAVACSCPHTSIWEGGAPIRWALYLLFPGKEANGQDVPTALTGL